MIYDVVNSLNKQILFFPDDIRYALYLYQNGSNIFNDVLRMLKTENKLIKMLADIELAFKLIKPTTEDIIVYRGVKTKSEEDINLNINILTSCAYQKSVAERFVQTKCCVMTILIPKGSKILCLDTTSPNVYKDIEHEILIPPGGKFIKNGNDYIWNQKIEFKDIETNKNNILIPYNSQIRYLYEKCLQEDDKKSCIKDYQKTTDQLYIDEFISESVIEKYFQDCIKNNVIKIIKFLYSNERFVNTILLNNNISFDKKIEYIEHFTEIPLEKDEILLFKTLLEMYNTNNYAKILELYYKLLRLCVYDRNLDEIHDCILVFETVYDSKRDKFLNNTKKYFDDLIISKKQNSLKKYKTEADISKLSILDKPLYKKQIPNYNEEIVKMFYKNDEKLIDRNLEQITYEFFDKIKDPKILDNIIELLRNEQDLPIFTRYLLLGKYYYIYIVKRFDNNKITKNYYNINNIILNYGYTDPDNKILDMYLDNL